MSQAATGYHRGYVSFEGNHYSVTWHSVSGEVYVFWGIDQYVGRATHLHDALDRARSWLNRRQR